MLGVLDNAILEAMAYHDEGDIFIPENSFMFERMDYTPAEKPLYRRGLISNLVLFIVLVLLYGLQWLYLIRRNRKQAGKRTAMGKSANIVDASMNKITARQEGGGKPEEAEQVEAQDRSLDDRTDFENEDFVYTY